MTTSSLRRQVKNIVHNYSEAEVKVREATSNDPWGPSGSLMADLAELTYNVAAFSEIMGMLWRRLNDHGRNWRHVYKALALADYLVRAGSERVAQQCRENVCAVQTLRDFQYVDRDGKDQGQNVRERARQLVELLKDEGRLREERAQALRTKEKLAQGSTVVASAPASAPTSSSGSLHSPPEMEQAWPQSSGEEELQLQLALAMSKEEADQRPPSVPAEELQMQLALTLSKEEHDKEERLRRGDDLRLQMAIEESQRQTEVQTGQGESSLMDLADVFAPQTAPSSSDPWGAPAHPPAASPAPLPDPWGLPPADPWGVPRQVPLLPPSSSGDAWGGSVVPGGPVPLSDSWDALGAQPTLPIPVESWAPLPAPTPQPPPSLDPWAPLTEPQSETVPPTAGLPSYEELDAKANEDEFAEFDALRAPPITQDTSAGEPDLLAGEVPALWVEGGKPPDLFEVSPSLQTPVPAARKTPESFLGPNAALVDLDALVSNNVKSCNPFLATGGTTPSAGSNPFGASSQSLSLNQLRASPVLCPPSGAATPTPPPLLLLPVPAAPLVLPHSATTSTSSSTTNPFLL